MYIRSQGTINITGSSLMIGVTQRIINILNKSDVTILDSKIYPINNAGGIAIHTGFEDGLTADGSKLTIGGKSYIFRRFQVYYNE